MSTEYEKMPTVQALSESELTVMAGGGIMGFAGVTVYKPGAEYVDRISLNPDKYPDATFGAFFPYNDVARISVDGTSRWVNRNLADAPKGRQDVKATGIIDIEFFDTEELRKYIEENREALERLGLLLSF